MSGAAGAAAADTVTEGGLGPPSAAVSKPRRPKRVECVVCMDARAELMLLPCKHTILCQACADLVRAGGKPCPMCRTEVEGEVLVAGRVGGGGRQGAAVPATLVGASAVAVEGRVLVEVGGWGQRGTTRPAIPVGAQVDSSSSSTRALAAPQATAAAAAAVVVDMSRRQQPDGAWASSSLSRGIGEESAAAGPASSSSKVTPFPRLEAHTVTPACSSSSSSRGATGSNLSPEGIRAPGDVAAARVAVAAATSSSSSTMVMVSGNPVPDQQQLAAGGITPLLEGTRYGGPRAGSTAAVASDAAGGAASIAMGLPGGAAVGGESTGAVSGLVKMDAGHSGVGRKSLQQPPHATVTPMNPRQANNGYKPETCQAFLGEMAGLFGDTEAHACSLIGQAEGQLDHLQLQVDQLLNHARVQLGQSRMELEGVLEEHKLRMQALCQEYGMLEDDVI